MGILNQETVGGEIVKRASTISDPELFGDPNNLTDARILNALEGDWFIPSDAKNSRWHKITFETNEWEEFTAGVVDVKDVAISAADTNPKFLQDKLTGTHGTQTTNEGDDLLIIDSRRTAQAYG